MKFFAKSVLFFVCASALLLTACSSNSGYSSDIDHDEITTASDESDVRRHARIRLELASGYFEQGQTMVALDELKQALQIDPTFFEAHNLRGLVYMRLGDNRLAEDSFRKALAMSGGRDADVMHNYAWLMCQQARFAESMVLFDQAVASPVYPNKAKSLMAKGICQSRAGQSQDAEKSLLQSYELDANNPVTAYNLANLLYKRGDVKRAQVYLQRLNASEMANAETLWLGIKVERKLYNRQAVLQMGERLRKFHGQSREAQAYERGAFNE